MRPWSLGVTANWSLSGMLAIRFTAPIEPRPAPRVDSHDRQRYSPKWYRQWKADFGLFARLAMKGQPPLECPLKLSAQFFKLKPKNPQSRNYGDLDNLLKAVKDAMNGICYKDDSQVVQYGSCGKFHGQPLIVIELEEIP